MICWVGGRQCRDFLAAKSADWGDKIMAFPENGLKYMKRLNQKWDYRITLHGD